MTYYLLVTTGFLLLATDIRGWLSIHFMVLMLVAEVTQDQVASHLLIGTRARDSLLGTYERAFLQAKVYPPVLASPVAFFHFFLPLATAAFFPSVLLFLGMLAFHPNEELLAAGVAMPSAVSCVSRLAILGRVNGTVTL